MIKYAPWWDLDTKEQCESFDEFVAESANVHGRCRTEGVQGPVYSYDEAEWEAFQWGWNAARKHYGVTDEII